MYNFDYLIKNIVDAEFEVSPFKHIYLDDFFTAEQFENIVESNEVAVPTACDDDQLIDSLYGQGFKIAPFPGCVADRQSYVGWHTGRQKKAAHHTACEGFGSVFRLYSPQSPILIALDKFIVGETFSKAIADKFEFDLEQCNIDGGIQKYPAGGIWMATLLGLSVSVRT